MGKKNYRGLFVKNDRVKIPRKIKKQIPSGMYCYVFTGKTTQYWNEEYQTFVPAYETKCCPMWFRNELGHGDCKALVKKNGVLNGANDDLDFCLDDQCKSCGIKTGRYGG